MQGTAVVVGGGIAGLAVGRSLRRVGWEVEVLERAAGLPREGTALGMWPAAMQALDWLGPGEQVRRVGVPIEGAVLLRPDGRVLADVAPKGTTYLLPRPVLHELLHEDDREGAVTWGSVVTDVDDLLDRADLVVGADGLHSRIRAHVVGHGHEPRPLGCVAFRGTVPGPVAQAAETWGVGRLFGTTPHDTHRTNWFASVRLELVADVSHDQQVQLLRELYAGWHTGVRRVLDQLEPDMVDRRVLYDLPPLPTVHRGRAVVIGDAAHAMAPNAGRGACEALVDAVALAGALREAVTVEEGLRVFDADRRGPGRRIVRGSRLMSRVATARRGTGVRDAALSLAARLA